MKRTALTVFALITSYNLGYCDCPVELSSKITDVARDLAINKLSQYFVCSEADAENDKAPCNTFAGRGLESIYSVSDFKTPTGYLSANAIWDFVHSSDKWVSLGNVYNEDNNLCAQAVANQGNPVIAVMHHPDHGHIVLVIPGDAGKSPKWNMLVAYSAGFLYHHPEQAYVGKLLSFGYQPDDAKTAEFFYRK